MGPKQWQVPCPSNPLHFLYAYRIFLFAPAASVIHAYRVFYLRLPRILFHMTKVPLPLEAKYTLVTRLGHETHKQQGMFPRP